MPTSRRLNIEEGERMLVLSYNRYAGESSATIEQNTQSDITGQFSAPTKTPSIIGTMHSVRAEYTL